MNKPSYEEKKNFAQTQLQFLKDKGIKNPERLSRIFKAAGPGQVQPAWHLAAQATDQAKIDLLDVLLTGVNGSAEIGRKRMESVLNMCGFTVENVASDHAFFRTLDGAMEILVPGSYRFTEEELRQIKEGLQPKAKRLEMQKLQQTP